MSAGISKTAALAAVFTIAWIIPPYSLAHASGLSRDADEILKLMSDSMGRLASFSAEFDTGFEIVSPAGQKLQFSASGTVKLDREKGALITRNGPVASTALYYDGETLTMYGEKLNAYYEIAAQHGFDMAMDSFTLQTGFHAPAADLLRDNPYEALTDGAVSGEYVSDGFVGGEKAYHVAVRKGDVDWQIWVRAEGEPLPLKYVITTKWVTGAPQFSIQFRNWNSKPELAAETFAFAPPEGAVKVDGLAFDNLSGLAIAGAEQ